MNEKFLEVGDVMQILGISRSAAYKLMRQINSELERKADIEVGKYGRMWIKYIKEEYPMRYKSLVRFGELEERADEVNDTAYELLDDIEAKWLKKHKPKNPNSFTEQLQLRTQTRMMAEEIVIMDVVMQFH